MKQKKSENAIKNATEEIESGQIFRIYEMGRWKEAKLCIICKKQFTWRKKWERCWNEVFKLSDSTALIGQFPENAVLSLVYKHSIM